MNKFFLRLGVLWLLLWLGAIFAQYGTGVLLMTGFMSGVFFVVGFAGDGQP